MHKFVPINKLQLPFRWPGFLSVFFALLLLLCLLPALRAQSLNFLQYSLDEGLPQSQVWASLSDHYGYLWFGTQGGGLARYDGRQFTVFNAQNGLATDYVNALLEDPTDFRIWIATSRGLSYRLPNRDKIFTVSGGKKRINALVMTADDQLLAGTESGLLTYNFKQDSLTELPDAKGDLLANHEILSLLRIGQEVLIGTNQGLYRRSASGRILAVDRIPRQYIYAMATDSSQTYCWLGIYQNGLVKLSWPGLLPLDTVQELSVRNALALAVADDASVWVGDRDAGLSKVQNGQVQRNFQERDGLPHNHVRSLVYDREGELWVSTSGGGVARVLPLSFRHFDRSDGLLGERVYAVNERPNGELLLSVSNRGLQIRDSLGNLRKIDWELDFKVANGQEGAVFASAKVKCIANDARGKTYAGSEGQGMMVIDTNGITKIGRSQGLASDWVQQIATARDGSVYIASFSDGISHLRWTSDTTYRITNIERRRGLIDPKISSIALDTQQRLWATSRDGKLFLIVNDRVTAVYDQTAGLPATDLRCLAFDRFNRLWVAARGQGLYWAKLSKEEAPFFLPYAENDQLVSTTTYLLQPSDEGLWLGSETGVELLRFAAEDGAPTSRQFFGRAEGFLGVETCHNAVTPPDKNGRIWFGTMNGLMLYQPGLSVRQVPPPLLHLNEVSLFYRALEETSYAEFRTLTGLRPGLELRHTDNNLSFGFSAVDLTYPERVRYRYRLSNEETAEWSPPNQSTEVSYAGLAPGTYLFEVAATNNDGLSWSAVRRAEFSIATPYWQTRRFIWSVALAAILLTALGTWLLIRRVKKREARRRKELETEHQLLQLEQKALQLQMNPHFIFNALTSIRSLVGTSDEERAKAEITNFAALMRGILNNSRQNSIALVEEIRVLDQYLKTEQFCQANSFTYHLQLLDGIDPEEIELPPMLLQPFVENAVVHGIAHLARPGQINIAFHLEQAVLVITIQDNGIGREAAGKLKENKRPGHQSVALAVTRQRLEALRGNRNYRPLIVQDRFNEQREIVGTEVIIRLPVEVW